jgi:hypothetical protein
MDPARFDHLTKTVALVASAAAPPSALASPRLS